MLKSSGKIIYNPYSHIGTTINWAIVVCDEEICKYYIHLFKKEFPCKTKLTRPIFGAHISFIRGEKPRNDLWEIDKNKLIDFEYIPGILDNKEHFWLNIKCDYLLNLRERYGLEREPKFGLHLTVARIAG